MGTIWPRPRLEGFRAARERHLRVHGESLVGELTQTDRVNSSCEGT